MTNQHPITPPPELVQQWRDEALNSFPDDENPCPCDIDDARDEYIATQAARWSADQELEACCEWVEAYVEAWGGCGDALRAARRPKPKSLAEVALEAAQRFYAKGHEDCTDEEIGDDFDIIRRALERLQELEGQADG